MLRRLVLVALVTLTAIMFAAPAFANIGYGYGGLGGYGVGPGAYGAGIGMGGYGSDIGMSAGAAGAGTSVGAPQDCMATMSCNVPVTQMVPYMTTRTDMQTVNYPVTVPQQSSVTVPKAVIVPEEVPVTTYQTACAQTQVPVQVPDVAYQPCTTMVPQTKTFSVGGADTAGMMAGGAGAWGDKQLPAGAGVQSKDIAGMAAQRMPDSSAPVAR